MVGGATWNHRAARGQHLEVPPWCALETRRPSQCLRETAPTVPDTTRGLREGRQHTACIQPSSFSSRGVGGTGGAGRETDHQKRTRLLARTHGRRDQTPGLTPSPAPAGPGRLRPVGAATGGPRQARHCAGWTGGPHQIPWNRGLWPISQVQQSCVGRPRASQRTSLHSEEGPLLPRWGAVPGAPAP